MIRIEEIQIELIFLFFILTVFVCLFIGGILGRWLGMRAGKSLAERTLAELYKEYGDEMLERTEEEGAPSYRLRKDKGQNPQ